MQETEAVVERYSLRSDSPKDSPPFEIDQQLPVWLLIYWSITSLVAYSVAGEKMPWLTVHIAWPMILLAGWSFGRMFSVIDWRKTAFCPRCSLRCCDNYVCVGLARVILAWNSDPLPFAGNELDQLGVTSSFLFSVVMVLAVLECCFTSRGLKRVSSTTEWLLWSWLHSWVLSPSSKLPSILHSV